MARVVLRNALFFGRQQVSTLVIPWCSYTEPEITHVGLTGHQAREQGVEVQMLRLPLYEVDRAILDGDTEGFAAVLVRQGSDQILEATIVAEHARDLLAPVVLAMTQGLGLGALSQTILPYPTQAEVLKRLGDAYQKGRLTPWVAGLFRRFLRWRR
jgi:pyruvate/2-oxoglutarate dehydrogenase complex dihydrolipoamide dehydrogenase (E3) component